MSGALFVDGMDRIKLLSYAKINLTLEVSSLRPDGYHDIDSVVQIIDLSDELDVVKAEPGVVEVTVVFGDAPSGPGNSVYKACREFFTATGISGGARCALEKRIPSQAGLGGGSGNAAAAISALNKLYDAGLNSGEMAAIAAKVGSDAPLFIYGGTLRMRGRGERIEPLPDAPTLHLVVVKPDVGVSTAWAYSELDKAGRSRAADTSDRAESAIRSGDRAKLLGSLSNDFGPSVCSAFGQIAVARQALTDAGADRVLLCGSGSAVFGAFDTERAAKAAAFGIRSEFARVFVTRTLARHESLPVGMA